ncbi:uncharacterized protein C9orf40 homolog [Hyperolius riggenbachi]|uniref:uncharacterized protein C9orf40 homolog n=1 Tax=Hyperolius riggenbachi TaxID=752182 RepID=UPI0035A2D345
MKRKCEAQLLAPVLPPCKRALREPPAATTTCYSPDTGRLMKRKLEPECAALVDTVISSPECERKLRTAEDIPAETASSPYPCKKRRMTAQSLERGTPDFQCQKDEAFPEYNSFQYWRTPLPDIDFSEIAVEPCEGTTKDITPVKDVLEEMDS